MIHFCLKDPIFIFSFWCQLLICVNTGSVVHESITYDFTDCILMLNSQLSKVIFYEAEFVSDVSCGHEN